MSGRERDEVTGTETTGHEWDGIRELNNPLPRWWLWTFYATVVWGIGYTIAFPAWPMISGATAGVLGWSTRSAVAEEIRAVEIAQTRQWAALLDADLAMLRDDDPDLHRFAVQAGAALFRTNCSQCHGAGAAGAVGYPNLLDDDWLWGGEIEDIAHTIRHGIRNEEDPETRFSQMPAFADFLSRSEIRTLVTHVETLPGGADPAAGPGGMLFADNCASCHGADARGDRTIGAPDLADAIWLYGQDSETLTRVIAEGPYGMMPGWGDRLDEAELRALASYVHQLGGGEAEERHMGAAPGSAAEPG